MSENTEGRCPHRYRYETVIAGFASCPCGSTLTGIATQAERERIARMLDEEAESRRRCAAADRSCSQYGAERDHRMAAHALTEFAAKIRAEDKP